MLKFGGNSGVRIGARITTKYVRWNSLSSIITKETPISENLIKETINKDEFTNLKTILHENQSLIDNNVQQLLVNYIPQDFSLYYLVKNKELNLDQLINVIENNPGRVDSAWDLYKRHGSQFHDDRLFSVMIHKLLEEELDPATWGKIAYLFNKLENSSDILSSVLEALKHNDLSLLPYFNFTPQALMACINDSEGSLFIAVFKVLFYKGAQFDLDQYAKALLTLEDEPGEASIEFVLYYNQLVSEPPKLSNTTFSNDLINHIEANKLDTNEIPESLLIRLKLIKLYGMERLDFQKIMEKLHHYQAHAKFGIEIVQADVIHAICLKCFAENDPVYIDIINTLMVENIPIKLIQCLILTHSQFNPEECLGIYNKYINHVGTKLNEFSGRSPSGLLTESLILSYLYNKDREFAQVIFEKVDLSKKLDDKEIIIIKKLFKVYGEVWEDDNWDTARSKLHDYVVTTMKSL